MAKKLQLRGGTTSEHSSFTGAVREVTVDTDLKTLKVHDGSTAGGTQLAKLSDVTGGTSAGSFTTLAASGDVTIDTDTIKVDSANNRVGIGQATPLKQFEINNSGNTEFLIKSGSSSVGKILFGDAESLSSGLIEYGHAATDMGFYVNDSRKVLIEADGDLHVDGDVIAFSNTVPSDIALKTDIEMIPNALDKIDEVKGVTFKRHDGAKSAGVIAQDLEKVLPEAVHEKQFKLLDGKKYKTVQYDAIHGLLINCIKELKEEIKELKNGFTK